MPDSIPHDRVGNVSKWTIAELTLILLRQFKRLLAERDADFSDAELREIADKVQNRQTPGPKMLKIRTVLADMVQESLAVLGEWDLTFVQSLKTDMNDLAHRWQTTADFLDVANRKTNAELRISAGSALMALLGEPVNAEYLLQAVDYDLTTYDELDIDAVIAKRALLYAAQIPESAPDWLAQARAWMHG